MEQSLQQAIREGDISNTTADVISELIFGALNIVGYENISKEMISYFLSIGDEGAFTMILLNSFHSNDSVEDFQNILNKAKPDYTDPGTIAEANNYGDYTDEYEAGVVPLEKIVLMKTKLLTMIDKFEDKINITYGFSTSYDRLQLDKTWVKNLIRRFYNNAEPIAYVIFRGMRNEVLETLPTEFIIAFIKIFASVGYPEIITESLMKYLPEDSKYRSFEYLSKYKRDDTRDVRLRLLQESV